LHEDLASTLLPASLSELFRRKRNAASVVQAPGVNAHKKCVCCLALVHSTNALIFVNMQIVVLENDSGEEYSQDKFEEIQ